MGLPSDIIQEIVMSKKHTNTTRDSGWTTRETVASQAGRGEGIASVECFPRTKEQEARAGTERGLGEDERRGGGRTEVTSVIRGRCGVAGWPRSG